LKVGGIKTVELQGNGIISGSSLIMYFSVAFKPWGGGGGFFTRELFISSGFKKSNIFEFLKKVLALPALIICPLFSLRDTITSKYLDGTGFESRCRQEIFPFSKISRPVEPTQPPNQWVRGFFFGDRMVGA